MFLRAEDRSKAQDLLSDDDLSFLAVYAEHYLMAFLGTVGVKLS